MRRLLKSRLGSSSGQDRDILNGLLDLTSLRLLRRRLGVDSGAVSHGAARGEDLERASLVSKPREK